MVNLTTLSFSVRFTSETGNAYREQCRCFICFMILLRTKICRRIYLRRQRNTFAPFEPSLRGAVIHGGRGAIATVDLVHSLCRVRVPKRITRPIQIYAVGPRTLMDAIGHGPTQSFSIPRLLPHSLTSSHLHPDFLTPSPPILIRELEPLLHEVQTFLYEFSS